MLLYRVEHYLYVVTQIVIEEDVYRGTIWSSLKLDLQYRVLYTAPLRRSTGTNGTIRADLRWVYFAKCDV